MPDMVWWHKFEEATSHWPEPCWGVARPLTSKYYHVRGFRKMGAISVKRLITLTVLGTKRVCLRIATVEWTQRRDGRAAATDRNLSQSERFGLASNLSDRPLSRHPAIFPANGDQCLQYRGHSLLSTVPEKLDARRVHVLRRVIPRLTDLVGQLFHLDQFSK